MKTTRLTLDMGPDFAQLLADLSEATRESECEVLRRAMATYAYLRKEAKQGRKIAITLDGKVLKEVVILTRHERF